MPNLDIKNEENITKQYDSEIKNPNIESNSNSLIKSNDTKETIQHGYECDCCKEVNFKGPRLNCKVCED